MRLIVSFSIIVVIIAYFLSPNSINSEQSLIIAGGCGILTFLILYLFNTVFNKLTQKSTIGVAIGVAVAVLLFFALNTAIENLPVNEPVIPYIKSISLFILLFVGITLGINKTTDMNNKGRGKPGRGSTKILDTSVIIDGRIADVAEVGFIEGDLIIPKFVIKELQYIADSSDPVKRVRGRRGLDVIKKIQKDIPEVEVKITSHDFKHVKEVDLKLVELAKKINGVIITNDFNLNKVASLQNVKVLNLNELANAIKPIVLPGEIMKLMLVKEGKEHKQAVGYLDDGTMVVVDDAINFIGKEIDVAITSVLQTSTGRMIFAKKNRENMISSLNG
ncbi:MAG: PIN domain nuclease [Candidatus Dadabacteria bacterium]|nr:PIN domain nuclease [Candidatus Dadabacteria bacterium]NIQ17090.1 PIN domain nuclease [Candidatus Dadabacteria bacterium]